MARVVALALFCVAARADDLETVRLRALTLFAYPSAAALPAVVAEARALQRLLNASFYFTDIDYDDPTDRADWKTFVHLGRVNTFVQALTAPGSAAFEDAALSAAAHGALAVWTARRFTNTNWWYSFIGVPLNMGQVYIMLGENRTTAAEREALTAFSYDAAWWLNDWGGGANLVWMVQCELLRGLASGNVTAVAQGFETMWADVTVKSPVANGQGIMPDGSYHFHGQQPLNFAYGADWLSDVLLFREAAARTQWDLPAAAIDIVATFIAEGNSHMCFNKYYDFSLTGRGIDRPGTDFTVPFSTPALRGVGAAASTPALRAAVAAYADRLDGSPNATALIGARYFWTSDFFTIHRATWGASLKAHVR